MPNKIHITMFGQFSISYRDKRLCENEYRGSKMISLLEYLISQRGREITQNELIDLLWSDSKNPANALKTLVHRTRAILDEMIPCGGRLIAGSHSSYAFTETDDCVIDSSLFKEYISKAEDESLSRTRRISMYKKGYRPLQQRLSCRSGRRNVGTAYKRIFSRYIQFRS